MTRIVARPLDSTRLLQAVARPDAGATAVFIGTVRNHHRGRCVRELEYSAYESMAEREMADILSEAASRFGAVVEAEHRTGRLTVGDAAVIVVASHAHRGPAFDACRWTLDEIKRRVPIWKRETYDDGSTEWVEPAATEVSA